MSELEWDSDGLDAALASVCDLVESAQVTPPNSPEIEWDTAWETQNLHNGLGSEPASPAGPQSDRERKTPSLPDSEG